MLSCRFASAVTLTGCAWYGGQDTALIDANKAGRAAETENVKLSKRVAELEVRDAVARTCCLSVMMSLASAFSCAHILTACCYPQSALEQQRQTSQGSVSKVKDTEARVEMLKTEVDRLDKERKKLELEMKNRDLKYVVGHPSLLTMEFRQSKFGHISSHA